MSGPKVVRIITREEIIAQCERHLRQLHQEFERWHTQARRLGELEESELAATAARHARLRQLLPDGAFDELQNEVASEILYLKQDLAERQERAVHRATQLRKRNRLVRENAATLLTALDTRSAPDPTLVQALRAVIAGQSVDEAEAVLARGFAWLASSRTEETLSESQEQLAKSLLVAEPGRGAWTAPAVVEIDREPRLARIDHQIAQLQLLHGESTATYYVQRLAAIESESRNERRNMLLDGLVLDLSEATRARKAQLERLNELQMLVGEIECTADAETAEALLTHIRACGTNTDIAELIPLIERCNEMITRDAQQRAALARRQVVLEGLAGLGYEVREGMGTAWAEAGRVVLRKSSTPGYGVEVGGNVETGRLQLRAVALSADRDPKRDRDVETIWCGEFTRLQSILGTHGNSLTIERALMVGEVPLKVVAVDGLNEQTPGTNTTDRRV